ncbi:hypothetical protein RB595_008619 [Gaeumannomyces hyphopodioides]
MALAGLQSFIAGLDPGNTLAQIAYSTTSNQQLGYGKDPFSPFQFIPYGTWDNYGRADLPSVLEQAFRDTIVLGHQRDGSPDPNYSFIDILHLDTPSVDFFNEKLHEGPDAGKTLIQVIAETVDGVGPAVIPVVRFLAGFPKPPTKNVCPENFTDVFWPGGQPIFKNPKAMLYVGSFNPSLSLTKDIASVVEKWINTLIELNPNDYPAVPWIAIDFLKYIMGDLSNELSAILANVTSSTTPTTLGPLSWNHAKIVAVNGRALLTGGGNYYDLYTSKGGGSLIDNDITILGDAALAAHNYSDYLWEYLNSNQVSKKDPTGVIWSAPLNGPAPQGGIPLGGPAPLFPQNTPGLSGKVPVLSVGKIGNFLPASDVAYPAQLLDAIRDIINQILYELLSAFSLSSYIAPIVNGTSDAYMMSDFKSLGVVPAAWASRAARVHAISQAKDSVYMSQQMLVNWDLTTSFGSEFAINFINTWFQKKIPEVHFHWDGKVWPYDLLMAISTALVSIDANHPKDPEKGFYLVLSERVNDPLGYQDNTTLTDLKSRLEEVMSSMAKSGLINPVSNVSTILETRFHAKRSVLDSPSLPDSKRLHTKVVDVDSSLLYIGSDNAYPQWNEQFGVWIQEQENIKAWEDGFFWGLWRRALVVD